MHFTTYSELNCVSLILLTPRPQKCECVKAGTVQSLNTVQYDRILRVYSMHEDVKYTALHKYSVQYSGTVLSISTLVYFQDTSIPGEKIGGR